MKTDPSAYQGEITRAVLENLPQDLQDELLILTEFLPAGARIPYPKVKALIFAWHIFAEEALKWSGAQLETHVDPASYKQNPEQYEAPNVEDNPYTTELWMPFEKPWRLSPPHAIDIAELAAYLKIQVGAWGKSQIARRRHIRTDRLDEVKLGIWIHPENSTASLFHQGKLSLPEIVRKDLGDQKK